MLHEAAPIPGTAAGTEPPLLRLEDVSVRVGPGRDAPALIENIDLVLRPGETLGLVGESGSGKTTLGMAAMRLLPPLLDRGLSGRILYGDRDLAQMGKRDLAAVRGREISMILQDPMASLNPVFSVGSQIKEGLRRAAGGSRNLASRAVQALDDVRIPSPEARLASYPHQLSGGMRQRVVGAVALSAMPKVLIADEPTTSLDVTIQFQFLELLKDLQRRHNLALLFITHDFGVVARMCDRVAVMYAGQVIEEGPVRDIFHRPAHWYTRALLDSVPTLGEPPARLPTVAGSPPSVSNRPVGCRFHPRCPRAEAKCLTPPPPITVRPGQVTRCWFPPLEERRPA